MSAVSESQWEAAHFEGALRALIDIRQVIINKLYSLVKTTLVKPAQIGQVYLQPPQAPLTERLGFGKEEKSTRKIVADVVQVRGDWVCSTTKVHIVGEVESISQELHPDRQYGGMEELRRRDRCNSQRERS